MKYCEMCGAPLNDEAVYCSACGTATSVFQTPDMFKCSTERSGSKISADNTAGSSDEEKEARHREYLDQVKDNYAENRNQIMMTTGFDFQGYFITNYLDVLFDEMLVGLGIGKKIVSNFDNMVSYITGNEATTMINKLNEIKEVLRSRLVMKAKGIGANALIGIDFESSKIGDLMMVSMTATAVRVEKIASPLPVTEGMCKQDKLINAAQERSRKHEETISYISSRRQSNPAASILYSIDNEKSAVKIWKEIETASSDYPGLFSDDIMRQFERIYQVERMYGSFHGKDLYDKVEEYFRENNLI